MLIGTEIAIADNTIDARGMMAAKDITNWLYNGGVKKNSDADLGYFVGYVICKSYYEPAKDKTTAIRDMIQVDYAHADKLNDFLERSGCDKQ